MSGSHDWAHMCQPPRHYFPDGVSTCECGREGAVVGISKDRATAIELTIAKDGEATTFVWAEPIKLPEGWKAERWGNSGRVTHAGEIEVMIDWSTDSPDLEIEFDSDVHMSFIPIDVILYVLAERQRIEPDP